MPCVRLYWNTSDRCPFGYGVLRHACFFGVGWVYETICEALSSDTANIVLKCGKLYYSTVSSPQRCWWRNISHIYKRNNYCQDALTIDVFILLIFCGVQISFRPENLKKLQRKSSRRLKHSNIKEEMKYPAWAVSLIAVVTNWVKADVWQTCGKDGAVVADGYTNHAAATTDRASDLFSLNELSWYSCDVAILQGHLWS